MADYSDLAYAMSGYGRKASPYDAKRRYGYGLLQQGMDTSPIQSPWQGAARLAQALVGGWQIGKADEDEKAAETKRNDSLAAVMAEPDPSKRIAKISALDPELGMRLGGQMAVEQAKLKQQNDQLQAGAQGVMSGYGFPPTGQGAQPPQQAQGGITSQPLPLPGGPLPAGAFANNSGNIRATNLPWEGKGAPQNGFETFATPQAGANAQFKNFAAYVQQNPNMTVAQALAKWAPPNENDTNGYIRTISEATGINPGMPLAEVLRDPMVAARLLDAQTRLEKGGMPQGFTADTFIAAAGGPGQPQPGLPGPVAAPPQIAQGDANGMPPAPNPAQATGPAIVAPPAPPAVPDVPRPQPSKQLVEQHYRILQGGGYGQGPEAVSRFRAAIEADVDRQWQVDRERRFKEYDQQTGDYRAQRDQQLKAPQEAFSNEKALRGEFENQPAVKSFRVVVPMLESAKDAQTRPTRAADLNLVYAFAKLMDPDSVVRESETAGVVATASVADRLQAYIGQLNGQPMLNADTRAKLIRELDSRFTSLKASRDALAQQYGEIAQAHGLNPGRVVTSIRTGREAAGPPAPAPAQGDGGTAGQLPKITGDADYQALKPGTQYIAPDGSTRVKR